MPEQQTRKPQTRRELWCGNPRLIHWYQKRPSWRAHGEGRASVTITLEKDGSLSLICRETPEEGRGGKETYTELPAEVVKGLVTMIQENNDD